MDNSESSEDRVLCKSSTMEWVEALKARFIVIEEGGGFEN